jgi:ATP-dependent phosphoenolpyruvate carboxykinase
MSALVVITNAGNVYGTDVIGGVGLSPIYEFSGAKIGYNPQDRFMMVTSDTLFVTNNGNVFGAGIDVRNRNMGAVDEYTGTRIGYNPQDRFMVAGDGVLYVITDTGDVWWTGTGQGTTLSPVSHLGGSKIGYNPQDRFMVMIGGMLAVITNTGDVYAGVVETSPGFIGVPQSLGPIIHFSGSKIGYNPQDRFMVMSERDNTLFVITNSGEVFGAAVDIGSYSIGPVIQYTGARIGYNPQDRFMVAADPIPTIQ